MGMNAYVETITEMDITRTMRKEDGENVTTSEKNKFRSLAGCDIWSDNGTVPHLAFTGPCIQKVEPRRRVHEVTKSNRMLTEMGDLVRTITFPNPIGKVDIADIWKFSNAFYNIVTCREYGKMRIVTGLEAKTTSGEDAFYLID